MSIVGLGRLAKEGVAQPIAAEVERGEAAGEPQLGAEEQLEGERGGDRGGQQARCSHPKMRREWRGCRMRGEPKQWFVGYVCAKSQQGK